MAQSTLKQLIDQGLGKASSQGHEMLVQSSSDDFALYECVRRRATFIVGYPVETKYSAPTGVTDR